MKRLFLSSILALAFLSAPAFAQGVCMKRETFEKIAKEQFGEARVKGLATNKLGQPLLYEWWVLPNEEYTVTTTQTNGILCVVMNGMHFTLVESTDKGI